MKKDLTIQEVYQRKGYTGRYARRLTEEEITCDLSIIIPLFNAQQYVPECLNSVLAQRTDYRYEVLLVDDGSADDTYLVIQKYEQMSDMVKVIRQRNMGPGGARNSGLQAAGGRYIAFVDSDDFLSPEYVQRLLDRAYGTQAEAVKCGYFEVRGDHIRRHACEPVCVRGGLRGDIRKYPGYIWAGIFHRNLWEDICFPEEYRYEDMISRILVYRYAKCFAGVSDALYYHRFHRDNISNVLLDSASYQCLDQLFLPWELRNYGVKAGMEDDEALGHVLIEEWGELLYVRTRKLPSGLRREAFRTAAQYMEACRAEELSGLRERMLLWSFRRRAFLCWNMVNGCTCLRKVWRKLRDCPERGRERLCIRWRKTVY